MAVLSPAEIDALDAAPPPPQDRSVPALSPQAIDQIPEQAQLSAKEIDRTELPEKPTFPVAPPTLGPPIARGRTMPSTTSGIAPPVRQEMPPVKYLPPPKYPPGPIGVSDEPETILERFGRPLEPILEVIPKIGKDVMERIATLPAEFAMHRMEETPDEIVQTPEGPTAVAPKQPILERMAQAVPSAEAVHAATGAQHAAADMANFFTSPVGILTLGIGALPAWAIKLVSAGFAATMASQVPGKARELGAEFGKNPDERDYEKIGDIATSAAGDMIFAGLGTVHATKGIAAKGPLHDALSKASVQTYTEQYGKDAMVAMFERVARGQANPDEVAYYNWLTTGTASGRTPVPPGQEVAATTTKTVTTPKEFLPKWLATYLGIRPEVNIALTRSPGMVIRPRSLPQLTEGEIDATTPAPAPTQPGGPSAPTIQSPVAEVRGNEAGTLPPMAGGSPSELPRPTGAPTPESGQAPVLGGEGPSPSAPVGGPGPLPPISAPQPGTQQPTPPTLPPKHTAIIIRRADGTEYPAAFGGYWTQLPGTPPMISRWNPEMNVWSTGGGLNPGETIVAGDVPPKPAQTPLPPSQVGKPPPPGTTVAAPPTSEGTTNPAPTDAQIEAGNYEKRKVKVHGLEISIENEKGSIRKSKPDAPVKWEVTMPSAYGYIKGTKDTTGEHVDVYVGDNPASKAVFVIDQVDAETKKFDEPKVMMGFNNKQEAIDTYVKAFSDGKGLDRIGKVTAMTMEEFKKWLKTAGKYNGGAPPASGSQTVKVTEPTPAATPSSKWKEIGKNANGDTIFEDANGVRSIVKNGIRTTEAVPIIPGKGIVVPEHKGDFVVAPTAPDSDLNERYIKMMMDATRKHNPNLPEFFYQEHEKALRKAAKEIPDHLKEVAIKTNGMMVTETPGLGAVNDTLDIFGLIASYIDDGEIQYGYKNTIGTVDEPIMVNLQEAFAGEKARGAQISFPTGGEVFISDDKLDGLLLDHNDRSAYQEVLKAAFENRMALKDRTPPPEGLSDLEKKASGVYADYYKEFESQLTAGTWHDQAFDHIDNPSRYHPVTEDENPKGLKIGDWVKVTDPRMTGINEFPPGRIVSVEKSDAPSFKGGFDVQVQGWKANSSSLHFGIDYIERINEPQRGQTVSSGTGPSGGPVAGEGGGSPPAQPTPPTPGAPGGTNVATPETTVGTEPAAPTGGGGRAKPPRVRGPKKPGVQPGEPPTPEPESTEGTEPVPPGQQPAEPPAPQPPAAKPKSTDPNAVNHVIGPDDVLAPKGRVGKLNANINAIMLLKKLEAENRNATPDEKKQLAQYTGWGQLSQVFDTRRTWDDKWQKEWGKYHEQLKALLSDDEWREAARSTQWAHFSSATVIRGMWDAAEWLGFGGGKVMEPASGVGHFAGLQPAGLRENSGWLMIDADPISSRITAKLYPEAKVLNQLFQKVPVPPGSVDLAITNVPFSANTVDDPKYPLKLNLHNWFIAHMLDTLKPGGMVITITSGHTMDSQAAMREFLAGRAELMGAIRLPNTAFKENAGTEVTTDILFLRKPMTPEPQFGQPWTGMKQIQTYDGKPVMVNEYFADHPDMIAGRPSLEGSMHGGGDEYATLPFEDVPLQDTLARLVQLLPKDVFSRAPSQFTDFDNLGGAIGLKDGTMQVTDKGALTVAIGGKFVDPVTINPVFREAVKVIQAKQYLKVVNSYRALLDLQLNPEATEDAITAARKVLNTDYDAYVKKYGAFNARATDYLEFENSYYLAIGLENEKISINEKTGKIRKDYLKADVFSKRTQFPRAAPSTASNATDALQVSLSYHGQVDVDYIGQLLGVTPEEATQQLLDEKLVFRNPENGLLETPEHYLSGNVRRKLAIAKDAAAEDPALVTNVEALTAIQPLTKPFRKIRVVLGSSWVPDGVVTQFARDAFESSRGGVSYNRAADRWIVGGFTPTAKLRQTFGTDRKDGEEILSALLNQKTLKIYDTIKNADDTESRVFNEKATQQVRAAAEKLEREYEAWLKKKPDAQQVLEQAYNETCNNYVVRTYNIAELALPGSASTISMRSHQRNAIWRFVQERHGLLGHTVGGGKTFIQIAIAMECKRLGLAHKPMITVMNSTLGQFAKSFRDLYPSANILIATEKDMEKSNRKKFLSRIASGDYDSIIIPHSQFNMLEDDPEFEKGEVKKMLDELEKALTDARAEAEKRGESTKKDPTVKQLQKMIDKLRDRLAELADRKKEEQAVTFQQLGIDLLMVDEAHEFKKPPFVTQRDKIAGLSMEQSQRAYSLFMKSRYIQSRHAGRGVILSTGTPVTNTLGEAWHMLNLSSPHILKDFGVDTFDRFLSTFTRVTSDFDVNAVGKLILKDKLSRFVNLPEMIKMIRSSWDIITQDDLRQILEAMGKSYPKLIGGKATNVSVPRTESVKRFNDFLIEVYNKYNGLQGKDKRLYNYIPVMTFLAGKAAALDMRLIDETAKDDPGSKINAALKDIFKNWAASKEQRLTQAVFLDQMNPFYNGVATLHEFASGQGITYEPESDKTEVVVEEMFLYNDMRKKLVAMGVPEKEIMIVNEQDTKSPAAAAMFGRINTGEIRIVIGSTAKMGVGVNMQERLRWLYHLDVPWFPALLQQRNGRIERPGNMNPEVEELYYGMEKTGDVGLYAKNESKGKFMQQVLSGRLDQEESEDPAGALVLSMQEQMAALSGDPMLFEKVQLENRIRTLRLQYEAWDDERHKKAGSKESLIKAIAWRSDRIKDVTPIEAYAKENLTPLKAEDAKFDAVIGERKYSTKKDVVEALQNRINQNKALIARQAEQGLFPMGARGHWDIGTADSWALGKINGVTITAHFVAKKETTKDEKGQMKLENVVSVQNITAKLGEESLNIGYPTTGAGVVQALPEVELKTNLQIQTWKLESGNQAREIQEIDNLMNAPFAGAKELAEAEARYAQIRAVIEGQSSNLQAGQKAADMLFEMKEDWAPLLVRIRNQLDRIVPQEAQLTHVQNVAMAEMQHFPQDTIQHKTAKAREQAAADEAMPLRERIITLQKRLATVEKARLESEFNGDAWLLPYGQTPSTRPGISYSVEPGRHGSSTGEELRAKGIEEVKELLSDPRAGLPADVVSVALDMLDQPVMQSLDWRNLGLELRNRIAPNVPGQATITATDWLVSITRSATPQTFPHEVFHFLYKMLPAADQERLQELRLEEIEKEAGHFKGSFPPGVAEILDMLRKGMTSKQFVELRARGLAAGQTEAVEWLSNLYHLINPSEFFASIGGRKFTAESFDKKHESWFQGLWTRLKAWLQGLIDAIRRTLNKSKDFEQIYREVLSGKTARNPEAGAQAERDVQYSVEDDAAARSAQQAQQQQAEPWGVPDENWVRTQVMGEDWFVRGRESLLGAPETIAYAKGVFDRMKLPATWDAQRKIWVFDKTGFDQQLEFRNLLEEMKKEIQTYREPGKPAGILASMLDSVRRNMPLTNSAMADLPISLRNDLFAVAQGEISQYAATLGALSRLKPEFNDVAQSVDVTLNKIFSDAFGGQEIRNLIDKVLLNFREIFTEPEIAAALGSRPGAKEFMEQLLALNIQDVGGRLYRRLQATLVPKKPLTPGKLERNAKLDEAYESVIETLKREYGILPKERPGKKKLTPQEKLALMVDEKTSVAVGRAIGSAVADAEYNAGRIAMMKAAEREKDPQKKQDLEDHLALMQESQADRENRVEPLPEYVEEGFQLPEFKHWTSIREHIGYSPTSMRLVQDVIRGQFKGTKFAAGRALPADTRLDINALAKAPATEVIRLMDAFLDNVANTVELGTASEETKSRVMTAIEGQIIDQLNKAMARARDPMFREPVAGTPITAEQRVLQLLNAGLFADPRLNIPEMVQRAASKSAIQRLMPKVVDLTKTVFATPFYRQDELAERFADLLVNRLMVDPTQAAKAKALFEEAFKTPIAKAKDAAFKQAVESLTPKERKAFKKRGIVEKLHRMLNAGGADPTAIINEIARENGYDVPSPALIQHMRELSEREQRLRELTPADMAGLGPNPSPEDVEKARRDKATVTESKRAAINKELAATWARLTRPIKWSKFWSTRKNIADAINEIEVADMLLKAGFALRLPTHIATQLFVHIPTRAAAFVAERLTSKEIGLSDTWSALSKALIDGYTQTVRAIQPGLVAGRSALAGRSEQRNVDRLLSGIAAFDRLELQAKEADARGDHITAGAMRLFGLMKFSLRYVQACDAMQGTSVEFQELSHLVESGLIEKGYTEAERLVLKDRILGGLATKRDAAMSRAAQTFVNAGESYTDAELHERAWALVINGIYDQIRAAQLPADDFRARIDLLKRTAAWQERVTTGPGGLAAALGRGATQLFRQAGLPLSFARFANAIGTGINYSLMFTPLYATTAWRIGQGSEKSPWFETEEDVQQRRIQALLGTIFGILVAYLVWKGMLRVFVRGPSDRRERELWEKAGHRPGTVEIVTGPDTFIPLSLTVGPASVMAPYLAGAQSALDLHDRRAKTQEKMNAEAAAKGLTPGKIAPPDAFDLLAVGADAAWGTLMGSKTFSGLAQSISENASFNAKKGIAAYVSPVVPGLPGYQEITRAMGWALDSRLASVWDYLVPLPTSGARALNFLGEPVGTPNDIQRVVQTLTAGSYPWEVDSKQAKNLAAYESLFATGYRPPAVDPNKGYAIGGEWRPFNDTEMERYTSLRGENFRKALVELGPTDDRKQVQAAYQQANEDALGAVGVDLGQMGRSTTVEASGKAVGVQQAMPSPNVQSIPTGGRAPISQNRGGGSSISRSPGLHGARLPRMAGRSRALRAGRAPALRKLGTGPLGAKSKGTGHQGRGGLTLPKHRSPALRRSHH